MDIVSADHEHGRTSDKVQGIRRDWYGVWAGAFLIAILFWPDWPLVPEVGLDPSWQAGLAWATQLGLQWGTDIAFTYGPLGFARSPWIASSVELVVASALHIGACVVLVSLSYLMIARTQAMSPARATVLACAVSAVCVTVGVWSTLFAVVVMAGLLGLVSASMRYIAVGGIATALMGLDKLSEAAAAVGFIVLCGLGARRIRGVVVALGAIGTAWLVSWLLLRQQIDHVDDQVMAAVQVITGYAHAMSYEIPGYEWHYGVAIAVTGLILVQLRHVVQGWPRLQRVALVLAVLWVLWLAFRGGFTRHDEHDVIYFEAVLILSMGLLITMMPRRPIWAGAAAASVCYLFLAVFVISFTSIVDRTESIRTLARVLSAATSHQARAQMWQAALNDVRAAYQLTPELIDALGTGAVLADPWDISAVVATSARWDPLPALQNYNAYTPTLDAMNVSDLRARPRSILRSVPYEAIDGRNPMWESPAYQLLVYCDYSVEETTSRWQTLRPAVATRCGQPEDAGTVTARAGEPVTVPSRPGSVTVADIRSTPGPVDRLLSLLFKGRGTYVTYGPTQWRVAESPDAIGLMLNAPVPDAAFASLPGGPHPTLASSRDSQIEFRFVPVKAD